MVQHLSRAGVHFLLPSLLGTTISSESPVYVVPEDGGPVEVCLTKSAPTAQGFTVQLQGPFALEENGSSNLKLDKS